MFGIEIRDLILGGVSTLVAGVGFLIRKILTSEAKIALLSNSLQSLERNREEDNKELNAQLGEMRQDIKNLLSRKQIP